MKKQRIMLITVWSLVLVCAVALVLLRHAGKGGKDENVILETDISTIREISVDNGPGASYVLITPDGETWQL